ncbi:MAG: Gfo/Idh/MocA family protein [Bacillota bacterium]
MKHLTRRTFLKGSLIASATFSVTARSWAQIAGANEAIRVAVVGFNGQGGSHISALSKLAGVRLVALCDADQNVLDRGIKKLKEQNTEVAGYQDVRKLLDDKSIDAISTATPNHWHSLLTIWACQAGKDVYVEKPVSHNVFEGRKAVEAARKYNRIVQTGTQCRSSTGLIEAIKWLHEGNLGKLMLVRGLCYKPRGSIGKVAAPTPIPANIDYDLWCGPAPMEPLRRKNLHYDWHWVWATGCGDLGNQGIHQMDIARWILREDHLSSRVFSVGGRLGYIDDGETPNTQFIFHDYPEAPLIFEVRGLKTPDYRGAKIGVVVDCEGGSMVIPSYSDATAFDKAGKEIKKWKGGGNHHGNWIKAIRSRKYTDLNADILEGHLSSALCHTGNISYRLGLQSPPNEIREQIKSHKGASETFERMAEHLAANNVDLRTSQAILGPVLTMDPVTERFPGNDKANALLTRNYRKPYVVPETV